MRRGMFWVFFPVFCLRSFCERGQLFFEGFGLSSLCQRYAESYELSENCSGGRATAPVQGTVGSCVDGHTALRLLDSTTRWYVRLVDHLESAFSSNDEKELLVLEALNKRAVDALAICLETDRLCMGVLALLQMTAMVIKNALQDRSPQFPRA